MKNFTKRNGSQLFVAQAFFAFLGTVVFVFLPGSIGAQSVSDETASGELLAKEAAARLTASSTAEAERLAASTTAAVLAESLAAEKKMTDEQILRQLEAFRGILPNSTLDALEKKYQVGPYAPKQSSSVVPTVSVAGKTDALGGSFVFLKNLKQGNIGEDVRMLQKILNRSADTEIAKTGIGSPGNETDYFGALTKAAVIRFQNKHAAEILTPNGLSSGTGFVGLSTRVVLNDIAAGKTVRANSLPQTQIILRPKITYCEPAFAVLHATELTASESASIGCVTASSKASCEAVDAYTASTATLSKDGVPDCRWVMR